MKFNFWWAFLIALGLTILGFVGYRIFEKVNKTKADAQKKGPGSVAVTVVAAERRDIVGRFTATGTLEAPENVKISPKTSGRITYLRVHEGDKIKKGQTLARLDSADLQAGVAQAQANLAQAQYRLAQANINSSSTYQSGDSQLAAQRAAVDDANNKVLNTAASVDNAQVNVDAANATLDRQQQLYDNGGLISAQTRENYKNAKRMAEGQLRSAKAANESAKAQLNQAQASLATAIENNKSNRPAYDESLKALQAAVDAAEASVSSAKAKLNDTVLTSPMDGVVTDRLLDEGAIASPGQAILAVQFVNSMWVTLAVPENVILKTSLGQTVDIVLDALPGKKFTAEIVQINPAADTQSRQFTVRAILDNIDGLFKPGMFAKVTVETSRVKDVVAVPQEAIKKDKTESFVFVVTADNKAKRRTVKVGATDTTYTEITDGIKAGDNVVTISATPLRDDVSVNTGAGAGEGKGGKKGGGSATIDGAAGSSTTTSPGGESGGRKNRSNK